MKALLALVGLATIFFLSGCAHDHSETKRASQPPVPSATTFTVISNGAAPSNYLWETGGTNISGMNQYTSGVTNQ